LNQPVERRVFHPRGFVFIPFSVVFISLGVWMLWMVIRHGDNGDSSIWIVPFGLALMGAFPIWVRFSEFMVFDSEGVEVRNIVLRRHRYRRSTDSARVKNMSGIIFWPKFTVAEFKARGGPTILFALDIGFARDREEIISLMWGKPQGKAKQIIVE